MSDDEFHAIIRDALERARKVSCSAGEYVDGLQSMVLELEIELTAAEESADRENN